MTVLPSLTARNLGVILTDYPAPPTSLLWPNPADLPSATSAGLPVQAPVIYRLDYCNSLLAGPPASATKLLQHIQNAAARLVFNLPKLSHVTPLLLRDLHWLPVAVCIRFKTTTLAFKAVNGTAPIYLQTLVRQHATQREHLALLYLQAGWCRRHWQQTKLAQQTEESLAIFRKRLKTHLFCLHLDPTCRVSLPSGPCPA